MITYPKHKHDGQVGASRSWWRVYFIYFFLMGLVGCASTDTLSQAYYLYDQGHYRQAHQMSSNLVYSRQANRHEAAYLAGLSAYQLKNFPVAMRYLQIAKRSSDHAIAGDAHATVGLIHTQHGRYQQGFHSLLEAAKHLTGDDSAKAYFYAALAQQKLGNFHTAWTYLTLAQGLTKQQPLLAKIQEVKVATGWTIQAGAFVKRANARQLKNKITELAAGLEMGAGKVLLASDSQQQSIYLVQIGHFTSYAATKAAIKQLGLEHARPVPLTKK